MGSNETFTLTIPANLAHIGEDNWGTYNANLDLWIFPDDEALTWAKADLEGASADTHPYGEDVLDNGMPYEETLRWH